MTYAIVSILLCVTFLWLYSVMNYSKAREEATRQAFRERFQR